MRAIVLLLVTPALCLAGCSHDELDQTIHGPWWYATPNKVEVTVDGHNEKVSYRSEDISDGHVHYQVAVQDESGVGWTPDANRVTRTVQARIAALQVMSSVCSGGKPAVEAVDSSNPFLNVFSISCG